MVDLSIIVHYTFVEHLMYICKNRPMFYGLQILHNTHHFKVVYGMPLNIVGMQSRKCISAKS